MKIAGKTAWITGSSSGIGAALAVEMAKKGCHLILTARQVDKLEAVAATCCSYGIKCLVNPADLSDSGQRKAAWLRVEEAGFTVDILVNNSGVSQRSNALETNPMVDRNLMEINYFAAIELTKLAGPSMLKKGIGKFVVISSLSGKFGWKQRSSYAASKFALLGFFESLRAELSGSGVTVLNVIPGRIQTDISLHALNAAGKPAQQQDKAQLSGIPAHTCAIKIVQAIESDRKEVVIAGKEKWMLYIRQFAPWLYYKLAAQLDPNR